jgi:hypothetical protein
MTLTDRAALDQWGTAVFGEWDAQGSQITVHGDAVLAPSGRVDTLDGLFTVADTGSLTMNAKGSSAEVIGGFANHGAVSVLAGSVFMMGSGGPGSGHPDEFSNGTFTAEPDAELNVGYTELRTGARLDHLTWVDHVTVPAGETATLANSTLYWDPAEPEANLTGAGELVATDHSTVGGRIGGSITLRVPAGEVVRMGDAVVRDQARIRVDGELRGADITLNDDAVLDVYGVHRGAGGYGVIDFAGDDPGVEIIHPTGRLLCDEDSGLVISAPFANWGTVDSGNGFIYLGPSAASPNSQGTFRADSSGSLLLGSNVDGDPPLELGSSVIDGAVDVSGPVTADFAEVRGTLNTIPGGRLLLEGTTTMTDGSSIAGDVTVDELHADLGPTGTASLSGTEVTDAVLVESGTLSVPSLAPTTLTSDGTLVRGQWIASDGATIDLPAITNNDTWLQLGLGASFGDGLANLTENGPNGTMVLGNDLEVAGLFRNEGTVVLAPRSRLEVGGKFRQLATGWLGISVDATGHGRVRAAGPRDLAGGLWVDRDPGYKPPIGTVLSFITSAGAKSADDAFDSVSSPRYGTHKQLRVAYDTNHVRLRVDRVG